MCVACGAAVWWSAENASIVKERLQKDILKVMKEKYGRGPNRATDSLIDAIQKDFQCCGVKGPSDWASSLYNAPNATRTIVDYGVTGGTGAAGVYRVPASCCIRHFVGCDKVRSEVPVTRAGSAPYEGINPGGCLEKVDRYIEEQWKWLIIVAGVLIGVQFFALLFACCLCCALSR